jgi:phage terminase large subunit-like protein
LEEEDYLFLFSRLRRTRGLSAPLRVRSASNPGGSGHLWVKNRFVSEDAASAAKEPRQKGRAGRDSFSADDRIYIPARIADNPHLAADEYRQSLLHLPPVTRERLLNGDWSIQAAGQFQSEWLRYYVDTGDALRVLEPGGATAAVVRRSECLRFCTIDPASTSAEKARASGQEHSYSVIQIWLQPLGELSRFLFLEQQWRKQVEYIGLLSAIRAIHRQFKPREIYVEQERLGTVICQTLVSEKLPIAPIAPEGKEKLARAGPLIDKFHRGEVLLPKFNIGWLPEFQAELLAWTGDKREPCDQIDAAAYAAIIAERRQPQGPVVLERIEL